MRNIPLVDLAAQYRPLKGEILAGITSVLESMHLFLGDNVQALEREFPEFCNSRYGIGVADGTTALHIALRACGIGPGDEVITVSHTFFATVEAIMLTGAKPVFVDIVPGTFLMDVTQIEAKITTRTKAIIPVHLYGQTVDMDPLLVIAREHRLRVIEDACQAHGAEYRGRRAGSLGDIGCFSFYYSKNLGGYGEGGFITTSDEHLAGRARMIRDHGSEAKYCHDLIGMNGRLDELQAAVLRVKLPHLAEWNERRESTAREYDHLLAGTPVITPNIAPYNRSVFHLYVISTPRRNQLQEWLRERGIATGIHYPVPCHLQKALNQLGYREGSLPVTESCCGQILSLPMYPELTRTDVSYVAAAIHDFFDGDSAGPSGVE